MISLHAPAMLKLFLRVMGQRHDGTPEHVALYQTISLRDSITLALDKEDGFTCSNRSIFLKSHEAFSRVLDLFRKKTGGRFAVNIRLDNALPLNRGLGVSRSHAATLLWGLNELAERPLSIEELAALAALIHPEASLFFARGTVLRGGGAEEGIDELGSRPLLVVIPEVELSNPLIHKRLRMDELQARDPLEFLEKIKKGEPLFFNDLEEPVFAMAPKLALMKMTLLSCGFDSVTLCGTGSAMFCFGPGKVLAMPNVSTVTAKFLNRSEGEWYP